ncbi:MAG: hypothetical protein ACRD1I_01400 [Terriglobia bacterium]
MALRLPSSRWPRFAADCLLSFLVVEACFELFDLSTSVLTQLLI